MNKNLRNVERALGWQPFSLTNVSGIGGGLGNPAAVHRGLEHTRPTSWRHVHVFADRGLLELFEGHGPQRAA